METRYPAQGPINPGDQSHRLLVGGPIEASALLYMDWLNTRIVSTWRIRTRDLERTTVQGPMPTPPGQPLGVR